MRYKTKQKQPDIWFAWYPVKNNNDVWVWLEKLNRIPVNIYDSFIYFTYSDITDDQRPI